MQSRIKSPILWAAMFGLVAMVAKNWFGFDIPGWNEITTGILAVLVGFGVVNNPTDNEKL